MIHDVGIDEKLLIWLGAIIGHFEAPLLWQCLCFRLLRSERGQFQEPELIHNGSRFIVSKV